MHVGVISHILELLQRLKIKLNDQTKHLMSFFLLTTALFHSFKKTFHVNKI